MHVRRIREQLPHMRVIALTDYEGVEDSVPLQYNYPGWWSKLELCRPGLHPGPLLFADLDTVFIQSIGHFAQVSCTHVLQDFYRPAHYQSSFMFLTKDDRDCIWSNWSGRSPKIIQRFSKLRVGQNGDQNFIEEVLRGNFRKVKFWQDEFPDEFVSYKVHKIEERGIPKAARVVIFHGKPRPWDKGVRLERQK